MFDSQDYQRRITQYIENLKAYNEKSGRHIKSQGFMCLLKRLAGCTYSRYPKPESDINGFNFAIAVRIILNTHFL